MSSLSPGKPSRTSTAPWRVVTVLLALVCATLLLPASARAQQEAPAREEVLILYEEGPSADIEAKVKAVCEIYTFMARNYRCSPASEAGDIEGYACIVLIADPAADMPETLIKQFAAVRTPIMVIGRGALEELGVSVAAYTGRFSVSYEFYGDRAVRWETGVADITIPAGYEGDYGGTVKVAEGLEFPLCARVGSISSIAWFDPSKPTMIPAMASMLTDWMWPFQDRPHSYAGYLVLDMVYPFADIEHMMSITDMLIEENAPYAITVMPIYDNAHFPAMKKFCEYLRYAQSKGAAIVLRTPIVTLAQTDPDEINERLSLSYDAYSQYGVYPMALEAPKAYLFTEEGLSVLRMSRTVLLFETDDALSGIPQANLSFKDGHYIIAPAYTDWAHLYGSAFSSAVYLDVHKDAEALRAEVRSHKNSTASLRSLWGISNSVYTLGGDYFTTDAEGAIFNGDRVDLGYAPFLYDAKADFDRGFMRFFTAQLEASNRVIIGMVLLGVLVSGTLIAIARRRMKRDFFIKAPTPEKTDRGVGL